MVGVELKKSLEICRDRVLGMYVRVVPRLDLVENCYFTKQNCNIVMIPKIIATPPIDTPKIVFIL